MKTKTCAKVLFALFMAVALLVASFPMAVFADDAELIYVEKSMSGFVNPQYSVAVDGKTANLTAFNQIDATEHMFVVIANVESQKFLTTMVSGGQCELRDLNESVYNADAEVNKAGSMINYVWLLVKMDDNKFQLRPAFATAGRLAEKNSAVTLVDNTDLSTEDENWMWTIEQLSETNGAHVAIKHISTDGYLGKDGDKAKISADLSSNPAVQWMVYPVFQSVNPYTIYGFAQDSTDIPVESRTTYEANVVHTLNASITSMGGKGAFTYTGAGSAADALITADIAKATNGDATTQRFELTSYGIHRKISTMAEVEDREDPQFMLWEINPVDYVEDGPDTVPLLALDASGELGFKEKNDSAAQRFLILYSMTADGGYYLTSLTKGNLKFFKAEGESIKVADATTEIDNDMLYWFPGCKDENVSGNDALSVTVKDVIVTATQNAEGKVTYTIDESQSPLKIYSFSNDMLDDNADELGVAYAETGSADDAGCVYNKLVVGTILSARIAEYSGLAQEHDGYELVGYTYSNIVPTNTKNVLYRYFLADGADVPVVSEDPSEETSEIVSGDASAEASADSNSEANTSNAGEESGSSLVIIIVVAAVVVIGAVVAVLVLKKKK